MNSRLAALLVATLSLAATGTPMALQVTDPIHARHAASYAILARDPLTGEYGVAAASHAPLIGMNLDFLDIDAGGVVVLGGPFLEINERVLIAMRDGLAPAKAIPVGLVADPDRERRQVLAIALSGAAAFSGKKLDKHTAEKVSEHSVVAGNRLESKDVASVMDETFRSMDGPLADRLLAALMAGRDAGGEKDGAHSAALFVVGPGARFASRDRLVDLRVDFVSGDAVAALAALRAQVDSVYGVVN